MPRSTSRRRHLFGAALLFVGSLGCVYVYWEGVETGVLRLGSRNPQLITLADSPERFQFWLHGSLVAALFFAGLGLVSLWAAFRGNADGKLLEDV